MGFIANLFSKRNKNNQTVSAETSKETKEVLSTQTYVDLFDYSKLSYDMQGWLTYPDGLKCRNISLNADRTFSDCIFNAITETKAKLGYKDGELFYDYFDSKGNRVFSSDEADVAGLWELFSNKVVCFIRHDGVVMTKNDIERYNRNAAEYWKGLIWGDKLDRGTLALTEIWEGIKEHSIGQDFIERIFEAKAVGGKLEKDKFKFEFEQGLLSSCSYDDYNVMTFDTFTGEDIEEYMEHSNKHRYKNEDAMKLLIQLQAAYSTRISDDITASEVSRKKFAYDEWGLCINYIAMGTYYHQFDMDQDTFITSTDGMYEILSENVSNGLKTTRIKAYNEVFTFTNGHSMPAEVLGKAVAESEEYGGSTEGYVYVMTNASIEGQVKIGKTTRDPYERAKELSSATGVPTPFVVVFYKPFKDCHFAEKTIHQYLEKRGYRVNNNREFFNISTTEAIDVVQSMYTIEQEKS